MQGRLPDKVFNSLVQGTGVLSFSKLPMVVDNSLSTTSLQCNIVSYTVPPMRAEMRYDHYLNAHTVVPTSSINDFSGSSLDVNFLVDSNLENYIILYNWLDVYKGQAYRTEKNTPDGKHWDAKQAYCPYVDILLMDNRNIVMSIIRFEQVYIETLGQLSQEFNSNQPVTVTASFKFNKFRVINNIDNINEIIGEYI